MAIVTADFETAYSSDYSLRKMSIVEYILDDRFEAIMLALKMGDGPSITHVGEPAIRQALAGIDWTKTALLAHNTYFDGAILGWRFGCYPALYLDTLSMARATTHWVVGRSSLAKVSQYLGLPPKGDEVIRAMGKWLRDFSPYELAAYEDYCRRDNDNCHAIFHRLRPHISSDELQVIDLVLRMGIQPGVQLDSSILAAHANQIQVERAAVMAEVETIPKIMFTSNEKFAALLSAQGVDVPMKRSAATGKEIPALAKNDWEFKELCVDDSLSPYVQALLAARLSSKSTIEETRTRAMLRVSRIKWPTQGVGWGPVPLKYSGARTHRFSGDDGFNWQNFRRASRIREAIVAPDGMRIVHRDASQIEARMVAWMSCCIPLLDAFAAGRDVYSEFAGMVYGRAITKADVKERFVGKTAVLGLGYGCGPDKFRHMLFIGNGGISFRVGEDEARRIVHYYRSVYREVPALWRKFDYVIKRIISLREWSSRDWHTENEVDQLFTHLPLSVDWDSIVLPSGLKIVYPDLRINETASGQFDYAYKDTYGGYQKLYGAKVVENISQALSRIIITNIMLRVYRTTGHRPFLSTHDSLDYCVGDDIASDLDEVLQQEFRVRPDWAPALPLTSEGGWGTSLHDAERGVNR